MIFCPDTCIRLLRSCKNGDALRLGRQLHLLLLKWGLSSSLYYGNCLLQMYNRCGARGLAEAHRMFDEMPLRNCFSWNSLIDAYSKSGDMEITLGLFCRMQRKNNFSWNAVISGLTRVGNLNIARRVFEEMPIKGAIAWNCLMHGYIRVGYPEEALKLYKTLNTESSSPWNDNFVLATAINACSHRLAYNGGRQIHAHTVVSGVNYDAAMNGSLIDMYSKCGHLDQALSVLEAMPEPDDFSLSSLLSGYANQGRLGDAREIFMKRENPSVALWNSMMTAYVSNNHEEEAVWVYITMIRYGTAADSSTFASILCACAALIMMQTGKQVHAHALKTGHVEDVIVSTALIDLYSKIGFHNDACNVFIGVKAQDTILLNSMIGAYSNSGRILDAQVVFDIIPHRSLISWNSMLVGYNQNGFSMEALELFSEMRRQGLPIDKVAVASALSACAGLSSLVFGEQIFALATITGLQLDYIISTSLIDLYCKCGDISDARQLFDGIQKSDGGLWNSMLMGYAANGNALEVLKLFSDMRMAGVCPNEVTFVAVLSGCCHCGLVDEGQKWFHEMTNTYHINPTSEHYSCIINLLARAGKLAQALDYIDKMPFEADATMWTSLLRGCQVHGDELMERKVVEQIMALDPCNVGAYVQISNIYAGRGDWEGSALLRRVMQERQIKKNPGRSWIDR